jgi:hypothetical protein
LITNNTDAECPYTFKLRFQSLSKKPWEEKTRNG